jgi:hypothetical protein
LQATLRRSIRYFSLSHRYYFRVCSDALASVVVQNVTSQAACKTSIIIRNITDPVTVMPFFARARTNKAEKNLLPIKHLQSESAPRCSFV